MSSLNKALLLTLVVSTCAYSSNENITFKEAIQQVGQSLKAGAHSASEKINPAMQQAAESVKAGAHSALETIKGLENVTFADVRKAAQTHFQKAKNSLEAFPAAFEQSANNALDYIKANKAETAINAAAAAYLAVFAYLIYQACQEIREEYNAQPYYAVGNGGTTTTVHYR